MSARSIWSIPVVALVALTGVQSAAADPRLGDSKLFDTWTGYPSGRYLEAVVAPDLNRDGKPDVAWARNDFFDNEMNVQLNLGDGTMSASVEYPVTESSTDIKSGDLDSDGDPDLVVISEGTSYSNSVIDLYFNDGGGTFAHTTAAGGYGPRKLVVADLDGDGDPDMALSNYWRNDISVLRNKGDGTFAPEARYTVGSEPNGIDAADLDADGDLDLAVVRYDSSTGKVKVHLLTNDGTAVFALAKTIGLSFSTQGAPVVAGADLDGDGDPDLAVAGGGEQVYALKNAGGLSFTQQMFTGGFSAFDILATDVDLDGDADLLTPTYGSDTGEITLLRNQGAGTFTPPVTIESGRNPHDVAAADFSGDGRPDLAVANRVTDTGSIHPQRADGSFAIPPIHATGSELPNALASADFDGDGDVDVAEGDVGLYEAGAVHIMRNQGDGEMVETQTLEPGVSYGGVRGITASDLNGDGSADLLWAPDGDPYPYVYSLNDGSGSFGPIQVRQIDTCGTGDATTADVDNDGDQDILVANNRSYPTEFCEQVSNDIRIALNNGNGTFQDDYPIDVFPLPQVAMGADLSGDGKTDLVATSAKVSVAFGTGGGKFGEVVYYDGRGTELDLVDVDEEGDIDIVTSDQSTSASYVMRNDGAGVFPQIASYLSEQISGYANAFAIDVGDLDGDGTLDLAVANPSGNNLGVHFGHGDGTFEAEQIRYGVHACFTDVNLADYDGDGKLDVAGPACVGSSFVTPRGVTVLLNQGAGPACTLTGTEGADVLTGTAGDDVICGMGGNDTITGRGGNDTLFGGQGRDTIKGNAGSDQLYGEAGADTLDSRDRVSGNDSIDGGPGTDTCRADSGDTRTGCP